MKNFNAQLSLALGVKVTPITMAYMKEMEAGGRRRPPPKLVALVDEVLAQLPKNAEIVLIGKSMGARVALEVAARTPIASCVALGFPFHPIGKPEQSRLHHFSHLTDTPCLILQGDRDKFGDPSWLAGVELPECVTLRWQPGLDHDFQGLKREGYCAGEAMRCLVDEVVQWCTGKVDG
jgi:predicted alpha/beta-hydrolase family hydrolase